MKGVRHENDFIHDFDGYGTGIGDGDTPLSSTGRRGIHHRICGRNRLYPGYYLDHEETHKEVTRSEGTYITGSFALFHFAKFTIHIMRINHEFERRNNYA